MIPLECAVASAANARVEQTIVVDGLAYTLIKTLKPDLILGIARMARRLGDRIVAYREVPTGVAPGWSAPEGAARLPSVSAGLCPAAGN